MNIDDLLIGQKVSLVVGRLHPLPDTMIVVGFSDNGLEPITILRDPETGEDHFVHPHNIDEVVEDRDQHYTPTPLPDRNKDWEYAAESNIPVKRYHHPPRNVYKLFPVRLENGEWARGWLRLRETSLIDSGVGGTLRIKRYERLS